jgi:subtilisin family serine protease
LTIESKPTNFWAVTIKEEVDPKEVALKHGFELVGPIGKIPNTFLLKKKEGTLLEETHSEFSANDNILWFERQHAKQQQKRILSFLDPMYPQQWHLHGDNNVHIHAQRSWERSINGSGITIAVVDDGLQYTHPDLAPNYNAAGSFDFDQNDPNPYPDNPSDDHGTSAAGVAGAAANDACGIGSAFGYYHQLELIFFLVQNSLEFDSLQNQQLMLKRLQL